ncbi:MAG: HEAT repeat domain-containing protein [Pirellulaceae bacterium]|nr:HEAT repeat domain-containing protein [Pirellulaceae bacterium]
MTQLHPLAILLLVALATRAALAQAPVDPFGAGGPKPAAGPKPGAAPIAPLEDPLVIKQLRESNPTTPQQLLVAAEATLQFGRPDETKRYLAQLLAAKPPEDDLAALPRQVGSALLIRLAKEPAVQPEGRQVADLVFSAADKQLRDPGRINAYIGQLSDADLGARSLALSRLAESGPHVVTPMLRALADSAREKEHYYLRAALAQMGTSVEGPLLGALEVPNDYLRAQVILILGRMGSRKAMPLLVRPAVDPATPAGVREAAVAALTKISGPIPSRADAERYLAGEIKSLLGGRVPYDLDENGQLEMWSWDDKNREVVSRLLSPADAGTLLAARLADDLFALKSDNQAAQRLRLMTALEVAQVAAGLAQPLPLADGTAGALAVQAGPLVMNAVLADAIQLGRIPAIIASAQVLGQIGDESILTSAGPQESPLALALRHIDRRVRFTAAMAVLRLQPTRPFPGASRVMDALGLTLATTGSDRILAAHPRAGDAQSLVGFMNELGYEGDVAYTGRKLADIAFATPDTQFILISDAIDSPPVKELVQWLRRDYRTASIPIGVMATSQNLDPITYALEDDRLTTVFPRLHSTEVAQYEVDKLLALAGRNRVPRDERLAMATAALDALAVLAQSREGYVLFDILRHEPAIISALNVPVLADQAAYVLGKLGTPTSQTALVDFASQNTRPILSRQAAVTAFDAAVKQRGLNLTQAQIRTQYDRYNASETLDKPTQDVLGALLDAIEAPTAAQETAVSKN